MLPPFEDRNCQTRSCTLGAFSGLSASSTQPGPPPKLEIRTVPAHRALEYPIRCHGTLGKAGQSPPTCIFVSSLLPHSFPDGNYRCQTGFNEKRVFLCLFVPSASAIQNVYTTL